LIPSNFWLFAELRDKSVNMSDHQRHPAKYDDIPKQRVPYTFTIVEASMG
jgi:hypothetical protein